MFKIAISNHPTFDNITRKAEMKELNFNELDEKITMKLKITHFMGETAFTEYDRRVKLVLDKNDELTFPTGENDGEGNPIMINNYTYFVQSAEGGAALKTLVESGIQYVDAVGTLNPKCNYKDIIIEEV